MCQTDPGSGPGPRCLSCGRCRNRTLGTPPATQTTATQPDDSTATCSVASALAKRLAMLRNDCSVIKRIPKAARASVADSLTKIIDRAISEPSAETWDNFLSFAFIALRATIKSTGDHRPTAASIIKRQVTEMEAGRPHPTVPQRSEPGNYPSENSIARRVRSKCADGDITADLRTLTSREDFVRPSSDTVRVLRTKHPPAPFDQALSLLAQGDDCRPLQVSVRQVRAAIESMPTGSSAGLDGMRPLHLRQLISNEAAEPGRRLLSSLTTLTNLALDGRIPEFAREAFYGASLCALRKKDGGLRPIAIGSVYRRLPCRIAAHHIAGLLAPDLRPAGLRSSSSCHP